MNRYEFQLRITVDQYLDYYRGRVKHVLVRCSTGQTGSVSRGVAPAICDA